MRPLRMTCTADHSAAIRPARPRPGPGLAAPSRPRAAAAPKPAPPKPSARRRPGPAGPEAHRPVPAVHLPDRQRRPPGRGERDADRDQLLRRRQRPAPLPGHADRHAERQRRGLRREHRAVHRPREVPRLDACRWTPTSAPTTRTASGGKPAATSTPRTSGPARRSPGQRSTTCGPSAGVRDTLEMYATGRPNIHYFESDTAAGRSGGALRHRRRSRAVQGERPDLGRREGHDRPLRFRRAVRLDAARHREGQRRHADRRRADPPRPRHGQLQPARAADRPGTHPARAEQAHGSRRGPRRQPRLGPDRRHHRHRPQEPEARAHPRLGQDDAALRRLDDLRHAGRLARARFAGPDAAGGARLRQGVARRHGRLRHQATATGCAATPSSPASRRPTRRAGSARC